MTNILDIREDKNKDGYKTQCPKCKVIYLWNNIIGVRCNRKMNGKRCGGVWCCAVEEEKK